MDTNPQLRTTPPRPEQDGEGGLLPVPFGVNDLAELVADLIETTGLVPADRLAAVRGRTKQGSSFAQAVLDEGVATPDGVARTLASRYQLPYVDLAVVGLQPDAAENA